MPSAWDMDGSWKAYPLTVLVERQTLWITASYENWAATLKWGTTQCETEAQREFSRDVHTESTFLPINENGCERKVNTADNARLDISARGLWNSCEKTFFDNHFHWLVEVWVRSEHLYRPLSLSVPQSLSLSCASLMCSHLVCIWGCDPQNLSLHKHSEWICLSPSIHISCRLHLWILVYSVHIQSIWLARLTAKKMPLVPLLLLLVVVTQGSFLPKVHNGFFCIFHFSLVAICFATREKCFQNAFAFRMLVSVNFAKFKALFLEVLAYLFVVRLLDCLLQYYTTCKAKEKVLSFFMHWNNITIGPVIVATATAYGETTTFW